jgi:hypothetical protein
MSSSAHIMLKQFGILQIVIPVQGCELLPRHPVILLLLLQLRQGVGVCPLPPSQPAQEHLVPAQLVRPLFPRLSTKRIFTDFTFLLLIDTVFSNETERKTEIKEGTHVVFTESHHSSVIQSHVEQQGSPLSL